MKQRTVEKAAQLSGGKVRLGPETAFVDDSLPESAGAEATAVQAIHGAASPPLSARERVAELEQQLVHSTQQAIDLQQQLAAAQSSKAAAESALAELQDSLAAARADAEERGYADGSVAAEQALQAEWQRNLGLWEEGLAGLAVRHGEYHRALQAAVADIALAATTKIIGSKLSDVQQIGQAVEHIVYESGLTGAITVLLAPTHYEELARAGGEVLQRLGNRQLKLQPDPRVAYGGCLLENAAAVVDGRYEVQLKKLQALVAEFQPTLDAAS